MTRDDVIRMAQEATGAHISDFFSMSVQELECFAAMVVEAERKKHAAEIKSLGEVITRQHEAAEQLATRVMNAEDELDAAVASEREACAKLASDLYGEARADEIAQEILSRNT